MLETFATLYFMFEVIGMIVGTIVGVGILIWYLKTQWR